MSILVTFNPISGAGKAERLASEIRDEARVAGLDLEVRETSPGPAADWLRPVLAGREALVVVGGDGAIRRAAPEAALADVPLVHCPAGNENLFARDFGMTAEPTEVVSTLRRDHRHRVDLVRVEMPDRPPEVVVLMASFGLDAEVVHDLDARRTGGVSNLSYVLPIARQLLAYEAPVISARIDGRVVAERVPAFGLVANSPQYAGRLDPVRSARIDDGLLHLMLFPGRGRFGLMRWFARVGLGRHEEHPNLVRASGRRVELTLADARRWQVDGDPPDDGAPVDRIAFEIQPGALPVLLPARDATV
ncbi:MAG: diacylglycerol kinase family protein [Planctomycetota bacterium]|nr:diacylglycerol kinase family protein [Planctomycetota bacterium]